MRDDMFKVIVERPRQGIGYYRTLPNEYRAAKRFKIDDDGEVCDEFCARKLPMRSRRIGWDGKQLNENLEPLRRYLRAQVGRHWNDVYSEICANLSADSTVKKHVRDHIPGEIEINCYRDEDDGKVYTCNRRWMYYGHEVRGLYVDPDDGIIRDTTLNEVGVGKEARREDRWKRRNLQPGHCKVSSKLSFVWIEGLWYRVDLVHRKDAPREYYVDKYGREHVTTICVSVPGSWNFDYDYVPIKRYSASKKDLKKYGLKT